MLILEIEREDINGVNAIALWSKLNRAVYSECHSERNNESFLHTRSSKLDMLVDLVEQANGRSVLVSYLFGYDREQIASRLGKMRMVQTMMEIRRVIAPLWDQWMPLVQGKRHLCFLTWKKNVSDLYWSVR